MKPFNLKKVKAGKNVVTRNGLPVKIIYFDKKGDYPLVVLIGDGEQLECFTADGMASRNFPTENDLFMADEVIEGWTNVYKGSGYIRTGDVFSTKKGALANKESLNYLGTAHIKLVVE